MNQRSSTEGWIAVDGDGEILDKSIFTYSKLVSSEDLIANIAGTLMFTPKQLYAEHTEWFGGLARQVCTSDSASFLADVLSRSAEREIGDSIAILDRELYSQVSRDSIPVLHVAAPKKINAEPSFTGYFLESIDELCGCNVYTFLIGDLPELSDEDIISEATELMNSRTLSDSEHAKLNKLLDGMEECYKKWHGNEPDDYDDQYDYDDVIDDDRVRQALFEISYTLSDTTKIVLANTTQIKDLTERVDGYTKQLECHRDAVNRMVTTVEANMDNTSRTINGLSNQVGLVVQDIDDTRARLSSITNLYGWGLIALTFVAIVAIILAIVL